MIILLDYLLYYFAFRIVEMDLLNFMEQQQDHKSAAQWSIKPSRPNHTPSNDHHHRSSSHHARETIDIRMPSPQSRQLRYPCAHRRQRATESILHPLQNLTPHHTPANRPAASSKRHPLQGVRHGQHRRAKNIRAERPQRETRYLRIQQRGQLPPEQTAQRRETQRERDGTPVRLCAGRPDGQQRCAEPGGGAEDGDCRVDDGPDEFEGDGGRDGVEGKREVRAEVVGGDEG